MKTVFIACAMQLYDWEAGYTVCEKHVASWWTVFPAMSSTSIVRHFKTISSINFYATQKNQQEKNM